MVWILIKISKDYQINDSVFKTSSITIRYAMIISSNVNEESVGQRRFILAIRVDLGQ